MANETMETIKLEDEEEDGLKIAPCDQQLLAQCRQALTALQTYRTKQADDKHTAQSKLLFPELAEKLTLLIALKKMPAHLDSKFVKLFLPHGYRDLDSTSICLIVKDSNPNKADPDVDKDARKFTEYLRFDKQVNFVDQVYSLNEVRRVYGSSGKNEGFRRLASAFDLFLVDDRITEAAHRLLGKQFQKVNKLPVPVNVLNGNVGARFVKACNKVLFTVRSFSSRCAIPFGRISQPIDHLCANLSVLLSFVADRARFAGGQCNVRSLHIQLAEKGLPPLPVYVNLESTDRVVLPASTQRGPTAEQHDLSTFGDEVASVRIGKAGIVTAYDKDGKEVRIVDNELDDLDSFQSRKRKRMAIEQSKAKRQHKRIVKMKMNSKNTDTSDKQKKNKKKKRLVMKTEAQLMALKKEETKMED